MKRMRWVLIAVSVLWAAALTGCCNLASLSSVVSNLATSLPQTTLVGTEDNTPTGKVGTAKTATPASKGVGKTPSAKPKAVTGSAGGRIAFMSNRDDYYAIYIMNPDG